MNTLTLAQKKKLKAMAHNLKPVVQIGQKGITPNLVTSVDNALIAHELIKIKFIDYKDEKQKLIKEIAEKTFCLILSIIGNIAILYRQNPDKENQKISI